jgi:drug/metabolite transporter (DMT)-like permease
MLGTYLLLATGMAIFGSGTPVSKVVTDAFPVFTASGARMLLATLVLVPLMVAQRRREGSSGLVPGLSRRDWLLVGGIAVAGMFLFSVFMLYGMKEVTGAIGGVVMATTPAVTAAGSVLFLRDRLDRWKALAIGCAVGGVLAVNVGGAGGSGGDDVLLGSLLVFGAVCGEAAYTLLGKRMTAEITPLALAALAATLAMLLFAPLAIAQLDQLSWGEPELTDWLALLWWGLGTMALGSVLWYRGVSRVAGTTASAFMGVMPISALLLSYLLLGESFELYQAVGMAAVLAGIWAVTRSESSGPDQPSG